jgi:hypothetical protein
VLLGVDTVNDNGYNDNGYNDYQVYKTILRVIYRTLNTDADDAIRIIQLQTKRVTNGVDSEFKR